MSNNFLKVRNGINLKPQGSDPANGQDGDIYFNNVLNKYRAYSNGAWGDLGSGAGLGRNYLSDWFNGEQPVGTVTSGITATGNITPNSAWKASNTSLLTIANQTSGGLREGYSLKLDHVAVGAAFIQTPEFTLDLMDLGKPVTVSFDHQGTTANDDYQVYIVRYNSSGVYQEQIQIAGTASATSPFSARMASGGTSTYNKFQGFFISRSTSTDLYALRFYRNNASDTTDIMVDSLYIGPQSVVQGAAITDWVQEALTITSSGGGSVDTGTGGNAENKIWWRQNGDSMEGYFVWRWGTSSASFGNAGAYRMGIPGGNAIDTSKIPAANAVCVGSGYVFDSNTIDLFPLGVQVQMNAGVPYVVFAMTTSPAGSSLGPTISVNVDGGAASTVTLATGDGFWAYFKIPIVGWSSNVTMANRAVEEYAYNASATWDADDSTTFGYGLVGGSITGGLSAGGRTKRVRFTTPAQPTDNIELLLTDGTVYLPALQFADTSNNRVINSKFADGTNVGFLIKRVSGSSTDFDVFFHQYAAAANDDSPAQNWINGWKWVLRKTSGGASVGYPVSARNVVGDTSGTPVPSGFIGEYKSSSFVSSYTANNGWRVDTTSPIVLTKGIWLVWSSVYIPPANAVNHARSMMSTNAIANGNDPVGHVSYGNRYASTTLTYGPTIVASPGVYYATTDTTVYLKTFLEDAETVDLSANMHAVRIA